MNKENTEHEINEEAAFDSVQRVINKIEEAIIGEQFLDITGAILCFFPALITAAATENPSFALSSKEFMVKALNDIKIGGTD